MCLKFIPVLSTLLATLFFATLAHATSVSDEHRSTFSFRDAGATRTFEVSPETTLLQSTHAAPGMVIHEVVKGRRVGMPRIVTTDVYFQIMPDVDAETLAVRLGALHVRPTVAGPDHWIAVAADPASALNLAGRLLHTPGVLAAAPLLARQQTRRTLPNDPLLSNQWHLDNTGQFNGVPGVDINVTDVWDTYRGVGVNIAIVDDGLELGHPDLAANINTNLGWDFNNNDNDPSHDNEMAGHGTRCAGVAGAVGNNNIGVSGVAPESTLIGLRLITVESTDEQEAAAMSWSNHIIHIKSNSWGPLDNGQLLEGPGPLTLAAFSNACFRGRGGRGVVFFWAGGNGRQFYDQSNCDGYANSIYTIAVGAINITGQQTSYSESGANLVAVTPSDGTNLLGSAVGVWTTDREGFTGSFGGTSASSPMGAGVAALLLQANPRLSWRDVQELFIRSATRNDPDDGDWKENGAGFCFNHKYGAGLINAGQAVNMALTWTNLGKQRVAVTNRANIHVAIPDNDDLGEVFTLMVTNTFRVEHAVVHVSMTHPYRGDLHVELISPTNTTSILLEPREDDENSNIEAWPFMSVHHWGESAEGEWSIRVADLVDLDTGTVTQLSLTLYGAQNDDTDGDGLDDDWEIEHFGDLVTADETTDDDGDDVLDLHEYLAGTQPTNALSFLKVSQIVHHEDGMVLQWPSEEGKFYSITASTNLLADTFTRIATNIAATAPLNERADIEPAAKPTYYRVELEHDGMFP